MNSNHQFIGPLRPGQKPPSVEALKNTNDSWSIFDLVNSSNDNPSTSTDLVGKVKKPKKFIRAAGGTIWEDPSLAEWDPDDYRVFCGDLGNDVTDEMLTETFQKYPSFVKAKVVRDKRTNKSKGYGFISFKDAQDYARASKDWNGKYLGSRPIKLKKSLWKDRLVKAQPPA